MTEAFFEVDMPDRLFRFAKEIPIAGARVDFDPPFYAFPDDRGLAITVLDAKEGDRFTITALDETGFHIKFTNGGIDVTESRHISGIAQSYGEKIE